MKSKDKQFDIALIRTEGDPIQAIANAFELNVNHVLKQHGAYLKTPLVDILRKHARPLPLIDEN